MQKILIIEDDVMLAGAYKLKLEDAGYNIQLAKNGQEGLGVLQSFQPDIIILDLIMPLIDGFTFISTIKENSTLKNIPIIVATNVDEQSNLQRAKSLGADACVLKSDLTMEQMVTKIQEILPKK